MRCPEDEDHRSAATGPASTGASQPVVWTGSRTGIRPGKLKKVAEQYHVRHAVHGDTGGEHYTLDHTAHLFLLNRVGRVAAIVPFGPSAEHLQAKVVGLLDDGAK